jgi:Trk-type K+ transport system membrane component
VKVPGKPAILWTRYNHRSSDQDGNAGAATDTRLASVEDKPKSFRFARAWMPWYGGLGIVVLSLALLMGHERIARRLLGRPSEGEGVAVGIRRYSRQVVGG